VIAPYAYSNSLWLPLLIALLVGFLGGHSWRRRDVPGALFFSLACLFATAWAVGSLLELAAVDPSSKFFWVKFRWIWALPTATAICCFILQWAGLSHWLTRRRLMVLAIPPLLFAALILTDGVHHFVWHYLWLYEESVRKSNAVVMWVGIGYYYALALVDVVVLAWLFHRSPQRRWPIALMLLGQLGNCALVQLSISGARTWRPDALAVGVVFGMYAIALFRFHVFDPVPVARAAAIDQMIEGMLVLDPEGRILDANSAVQSTLGLTAVDLRGRLAPEVLPIAGEVNDMSALAGTAKSEFSLGTGEFRRHYTIEATSLRDRGGHELGQLLLLHDVTEQERQHAQVLEQRHVVATLQERERLARELHDGVGQVFGYVSMQTQTIRKWLQHGDIEKADSLLARLTDVAQRAHGDVRESILALKAASSEKWSFLPTLSQYVQDFGRHYGLETELVVTEGMGDDELAAGIGVQLLRAVQEALTNAHTHGEAHMVRVVINRRDDQVRITVEDNGCGFDDAALQGDPTRQFGLAFMGERMAHVGGSMTIDSAPGAGTRVCFEAPIRMEAEAG
jgi:PAS domain S-box-containing protein